VLKADIPVFRRAPNAQAEAGPLIAMIGPPMGRVRRFDMAL
jgi:hypothetical protein